MRMPKVMDVRITEDALTVELSDGRSVSAPLAWFPRLLHASTKERKHWHLLGSGHGIHWTGLDEDISVEGLLAGQPSGESQASFGKWLRGRAVGKRLARFGGTQKSLKPIPRRRTAMRYPIR